MSDKKLQISADLKIKTSEINRELQKLSKEGAKISKMLSGLNLNKRDGLTQSLTAANKEMSKLRVNTQDASKAIGSDFGKNIDRQIRSLDIFSQRVERMNNRLKGTIAGTPLIGTNWNPSAMRAGSIGRNAYSFQLMNNSIQQLGWWARNPAGAGGMQPPGGSGTGGTGQPPRWQMNWENLQQAMGVGKFLTNSIGSVAGVYQSTKTIGAQNLGHIRDFERSLLSKMASGDFSDLYFATRHMEGGKNALTHAMDQYGGTGAGRLQTSAGAVGGLIDTGLGLMRMRGVGTGSGAGSSGTGPTNTNDISNVTGGATEAMSGLKSSYLNIRNRALGGPELAEMQSVATGLQAHKLQDPMTQRALEWTASTAGIRVGAAKALQGRHMTAWGIGQGFGLDMGESMGAAQQLARQFGVQASLGYGGTAPTTRTDVRTVPDAGVYGTAQRWAQGFEMEPGARMDVARLKRDELRRNGYEQFDHTDGYSYFRKEVTEGGRGGAEGLLRSVLGLERKGMDRGVSGTALGTMMMATGGNLGSANRQLEDVMTKAFGRGLADARLGEEIVRATGEAAFGGGGAIQNMGAYGMTLSGGLNGSSTMHDVQSNLGGVRSFDSLIKGNSYFAAVQLEAAKRTLGAGATGSQMLAVQRATMADLIGGSDQLNLVGLGNDPEGARKRRSILGQTANSLMGTYLTNSQDPATAQLRQALGANGGDIIKTFQGAGNNRKQLQDQFALALSLNSGMSQSDAEGLARVLGGVDSRADTGLGRRNYANRGDAVAEGTVRAQQAILDEFFKKEREIQDELLKALRGARPAAEAIANNDPAFEAFQKFFTQFMDIMQKAMQDPRLRAQLTGGVTQKAQ